MAPSRAPRSRPRPAPAHTAREGPEEKRHRILQAARRICAREGYEASTMDAVAAEAHVSKGTLYNFFDSKEHLFLSTVLQAYDEAEARMEARMGALEDPVARLEGRLEALVEIFPQVAEGMMVNLQVWAVVSRDAEARHRMFDDLQRRYLVQADELEATLRAGQQAGVFRSDLDVGATATGLAAIFDGLVYRSVFDGENANAATLRAAFDTLVRERVRQPGASGEGSAGDAR